VTNFVDVDPEDMYHARRQSCGLDNPKLYATNRQPRIERMEAAQ